VSTALRDSTDQAQHLCFWGVLQNIAAVRTARFDAKEFEGANSPRIMNEVYQSIQLARIVYRRADEMKLIDY
jgi:hypothetical protein